MIPGYNHNIKHRGRTYHVQTEDSGPKNPVIITHLFVGGTILASRRQSYSDYLGVQGFENAVRDMMQEQHKAMLRNLVSGSMDHLLDPLGHSLAIANEAAEAAAEAAVAVAPAVTASPVPAAPPPAPMPTAAQTAPIPVPVSMPVHATPVSMPAYATPVSMPAYATPVSMPAYATPVSMPVPSVSTEPSVRAPAPPPPPRPPSQPVAAARAASSGPPPPPLRSTPRPGSSPGTAPSRPPSSPLPSRPGSRPPPPPGATPPPMPSSQRVPPPPAFVTRETIAPNVPIAPPATPPSRRPGSQPPGRLPRPTADVPVSPVIVIGTNADAGRPGQRRPDPRQSPEAPFGTDLISQKSLDEVILQYLSEEFTVGGKK